MRTVREWFRGDFQKAVQTPHCGEQSCITPRLFRLKTMDTSCFPREVSMISPRSFLQQSNDRGWAPVAQVLGFAHVISLPDEIAKPEAD